MKSAFLFAVASLTAFASAQYYNISSKPFHLVLHTAKNKTLNGATLFPCHEGAAIEGLCLSLNKNLTEAPFYTFNTSVYASQDSTKSGAQGILVYNLIAGSPGQEIPSALTLEANVASNVGVPLFYPGDTDAQQVAFDRRGLLNIQAYVDDRVYPADVSQVKAYYRWYICNTYAGYAYTTLAWVYGQAKPQNPTCQKVDVKRVYKK